ncbi:asparagine synthase C-terminal domain-containing protein [Halorussus halophilus]|uniref:asparagine synthase C-terminal domain-containing protein n=1 Tax=Halorussus halophilus TaxID=2650975 RepID=UPI0013017C4F|nr:asparagine synthase-related protein [Halorussus halophilus]
MRGASVEHVASAVADGDALSGTTGFAGRLPDGRLVRDVLGRQPLFYDRDDAAAWSFDPSDLDTPESVPAGHVCPAGASDAPAEEFEQIFSLPDPALFEDDRRAVTELRDALAASLDVTASDSLAVAFSGGVDSAVVASAFDAPLYVVGFPESHDVAAARQAARLMDRELDVIELSLSDVEDAVPEVARETNRTNAMDVSIALPLFLAGKRAAEDGYDRLAVGQGADELFGGYAKVARAPEDPRVEADTVRGAAREVVGTLPAQLERDVLALRGAGVEPVAPLLDDQVVRVALRLPGELLVDSRGERKKALRLAAREFVPDPVAFREKKAVQYGSLVSRELDRLARQAGFKRRMDDHVSQYVASQVGSVDS